MEINILNIEVNTKNYIYIKWIDVKGKSIQASVILHHALSMMKNDDKLLLRMSVFTSRTTWYGN